MARQINLLKFDAAKLIGEEMNKFMRKKMRDIKSIFQEIGNEYVSKVITLWPRSGNSQIAMADGFTTKASLSYLKGTVDLVIFNKTHGRLIHFIETGTIFIRPRSIMRNLWDENEQIYFQRVINKLKE